MTQDASGKTVPPIPVGLEDLVGMAAASEDFAELLAARRGEAVAVSGVALAPTEAAVLGAVDDVTLARMVQTCRARQAAEARRAFLTRASAAVLLLVGVGAAAGCEKMTKGDVRTPGKPSDPTYPEMRPAMKTPPDASVPRERVPPLVTAGVRPPRPRPMRPSGVKTGISPQHRRKQKLEVETGSRPD